LARENPNPKLTSENLRKPRKMAGIVVQSAQSSERSAARTRTREGKTICHGGAKSRDFAINVGATGDRPRTSTERSLNPRSRRGRLLNLRRVPQAR
jgi:hypothetical protein